MSGLLLADHEPAADRKVQAALELLPVLVERDEGDAVGMGREALVAVPLDVIRRIERHHLLTAEIQGLLGFDSFLLRWNRRTVEGRGFVAFEPKHRGEVGEVAFPRECHRAVELDLRFRRLVEQRLRRPSSFRNRWAATMGPNVWELDGPTPTL